MAPWPQRCWDRRRSPPRSIRPPPSTEASAIDQVRLVCNEYGRCYRTRGPRYQRYYGDDDGYVVRRSYGSYGGPGYYDRGYGYYGGGPSVGFSFRTRSW
ncbi:hypothetical protein AB7M17_008889 [Bradyrhizobium sp. USDA 377]